MRSFTSYRTRIAGVIKDCFIIIILFVVFYFIDFKLAAFMAAIVTVILLSRRIIFDYNPGFVKEHHITHNNKELAVPKGIDVFDLSRVPSIEYLQRYIEVIRSILFPPLILIIRFSGILQVKEYELYKLSEIVKRLQKADIIVIFSDVEDNLQYQFRQYSIEKTIGSENICYSVSNALKQANKALSKIQQNNRYEGKSDIF